MDEAGAESNLPLVALDDVSGVENTRTRKLVKRQMNEDVPRAKENLFDDWNAGSIHAFKGNEEIIQISKDLEGFLCEHDKDIELLAVPDIDELDALSTTVVQPTSPDAQEFKLTTTSNTTLDVKLEPTNRRETNCRSTNRLSHERLPTEGRGLEIASLQQQKASHTPRHEYCGPSSCGPRTPEAIASISEPDIGSKLGSSDGPHGFSLLKSHEQPHVFSRVFRGISAPPSRSLPPLPPYPPRRLLHIGDQTLSPSMRSVEQRWGTLGKDRRSSLSGLESPIDPMSPFNLVQEPYARFGPEMYRRTSQEI